MKGIWNKLRRMRSDNLDELTSLHPQRIALIKPSALGDIVHALPVLTALRRRFVDAHISWIVNRSYVPLIEHHPDLNEVIPFDRNALSHGLRRAFGTFGRFFRQLRGQRFDVAIDLQGLLRTGLMAFATRAQTIIGLSTAREGARWFYTHQVPADAENLHAVDRYWRIVEAFDIAPVEKEYRVAVAPQAMAWARTFLQALPRPWMMVGVGARWLTKRWPPQHFASLVNRAQQIAGGTAIFIGSKDEMPLANQAARLVAGPNHDVCGRTTLAQLIALLSLADVMIANDTGPMHVAVALGRPVVAPYLCTQVQRTGPYQQLDRALESSVWCQGSLLKKCDRLECMDELTPDRMWPILSEILNTWVNQHHSA